MVESKICNGCGASFGCGRQDADCWCAALPELPPVALDARRDCYCPRCLAATVAAHTPSPPSDKTAD